MLIYDPLGQLVIISDPWWETIIIGWWFIYQNKCIRSNPGFRQCTVCVYAGTRSHGLEQNHAPMLGLNERKKMVGQSNSPGAELGAIMSPPVTSSISCFQPIRSQYWRLLTNNRPGKWRIVRPWCSFRSLAHPHPHTPFTHTHFLLKYFILGPMWYLISSIFLSTLKSR